MPDAKPPSPSGSSHSKWSASCTVVHPLGGLIRQNRQNAHADQRAEHDYEVNVRTYRDIHEIDTMLGAVIDRLTRLEATGAVGARDGAR